MESYDYYYLAKRNLLPDAELRDRKAGTLNQGARVHVAAACGKAMASVTCLLQDAGYAVTASDDAFHPPMSDVLRSHNITMLTTSVDNIRDIDLLVVGNALGPSSIEVLAARERGIPMMSGTEILTELLVADKRSLVVAGTHGKTTTSSLLAHVLESIGQDPAYMIGGSFKDTGKSYSSGSETTQCAVFEGDEYDCAFFDKAPKFLRYSATSAIITSIEHDHIDLYPTYSDYLQAFQFLVDALPSYGQLVIHESVAQQLDLSGVVANVTVYGDSEQCDSKYSHQYINDSGTRFDIEYLGTILSDVVIPLYGNYNIANALAVFTICCSEGLPPEEIIKALSSYPGVHERQEMLGMNNNGVIVIRDFAHHPTAVSVTLDGLRSRYPNNRIVCAFEPRSATSRRKVFESVYPGSFESADAVIISSPPFRSIDSAGNFMDVNAVADSLRSKGKIVYSVPGPDEVLKELQGIVHEKDVVVFMSNGDFGGIPHKFLGYV